MTSVEVVLEAWAAPGIDRQLHATTKREIRRLSPSLAHALDHLRAEGVPADRARNTQRATEVVAGQLDRLYDDDVGDDVDERWQKATAIVDALVRAGLI